MSSVKRSRHFHMNIAVIGGGVAGICAAVGVARNGAQVVLLRSSIKVAKIFEVCCYAEQAC